ncbi:MAG: hypothetical protein QXZ44_04165 [Ferroplasma sp.]
MIYYPAETGRNVDEIIRTVKALQMNWNLKLAAPVNWKPGEHGIVSAPGTLEAALAREKEWYKTWYLKFQEVN